MPDVSEQDREEEEEEGKNALNGPESSFYPSVEEFHLTRLDSTNWKHSIKNQAFSQSQQRGRDADCPASNNKGVGRLFFFFFFV